MSALGRERRAVTDLPVRAALPALLDALAAPGGAAVLVAEPGAGKTTLVPHALLDAPWRSGRVLLIEPRRLAARAAALRHAGFRGEPVGRTVGWRMRGDTCVSSATRLEVITDGVLTRMLHEDPSLDGVDAIVFDELHERSLDLDLGLALSLDARDALRPDLRLVAMSATLDSAAVAELLGTDTVLDVPGRMHPVDTVWLGGPQAFDAATVAAACAQARRETDGDVLVFLPGAREIRAVQRLLDGAHPDTDVVPLHGALPGEQQDRALAPAAPGRRKFVLATSIAQTSVTIEGVHAVVDAGWARTTRFDPRREMGGLVTVRVSRASADQRRGRAGRTTAGRCYRLWTEVDHARLAPFDEPEILAADLAPLALDLVRWGDPEGRTLRWLDPPSPTRLAAARELLCSLGLVDDRDRLTDHGRQACTLPVHPRLAHAVLRAAQEGHSGAACATAAVLSERDTTRVAATVDLHERVRRIDGRAARQARRLAELVGIDPSEPDASRDDVAGIGLTVALAFPERLARRRGSGARYLLAGGTGAQLDPHDPLARSEWIAIAALDLAPTGGDARVLLAAALDAGDVSVAFGDRIVEDETVTWDRQARDVTAETQRRLGAIVLSRRAIDAGADAIDALLDGVRTEGLDLLPQWAASEPWRARARWCHATFGDEWPDLGADALLETVDEWLAPWLAGARRRRDLAGIDVTAALRAIVPPHLLARLDELAPTHVTLPSGRTRPIDYRGEAPSVSLRLQDAFGWHDTPRVLDGRVPVVLHLLSPADRPIQVTSDFAAFWKGSYAQVRAEMRGRYPKHAWPEDPSTAAPRDARAR